VNAAERRRAAHPIRTTRPPIQHHRAGRGGLKGTTKHKPKTTRVSGGAGHGTGISPGGGGGGTTPAQPPMKNNPPYQTNYGAYLYMEQHSPQPKPPAATPPNVEPPTVPVTHIHVHSPIHRARIIKQHPAATLPFSSVMGRSSKVPHLHHYGSIPSQQAHR
jgi:hypothetical protein